MNQQISEEIMTIAEFSQSRLAKSNCMLRMKDMAEAKCNRVNSRSVKGVANIYGKQLTLSGDARAA